jgi:hypothetical protein
LVALTVGILHPDAYGQSASEKILRKGIAYYNTDDISDQAAAQFMLILRNYKTSSEAESAQYYLASYYQRKFYIIKRNQGREDKGLLAKAKTEYGNYTKNYLKQGSKWLSDAFFNLALVYFQLNDSKNAGWELNKMGQFSGMDPQVYIYEVVWSPDSGDVIDGWYQADALAEFVKGNSEKSFQNLINVTKRWCRASKTK